jgi:hypothetical protein
VLLSGWLVAVQRREKWNGGYGDGLEWCGVVLVRLGHLLVPRMVKNAVEGPSVGDVEVRLHSVFLVS